MPFIGLVGELAAFDPATAIAIDERTVPAARHEGFAASLNCR